MKVKSISSDHMGLVLSGACLFHCIALPFILAAIGIYGESEWMHLVFLISAIFITGHAMWHSYKQHFKPIVLVTGTLGIIFLAFGVILHHGLDEIATITGSLFLVVTHVVNFYLCRKSTNCGVCNE